MGMQKVWGYISGAKTQTIWQALGPEDVDKCTSLLDVGCRDMVLRQSIPKRLRYCGVDRMGQPDVLANLEEGLPFNDGAFDIVCGLDVLEHTNNFHFCIGELCRVAARWVIINLPNEYHLFRRLRFLLGKPISGKHGLKPTPQIDRHRWLINIDEARKTLNAVVPHNGFVVDKEVAIYLRPIRRRYLYLPLRLLFVFPAGIGAWAYAICLRRHTIGR